MNFLVFISPLDLSNMFHLTKGLDQSPHRRQETKAEPIPGFSKMLFLHAVATLIAALLAWFLPLYSISAPGAGIFSLRITGWSGDEISSWAFKCWPRQDYSNISWYGIASLLIVIVVFILSAKQGESEGETREREKKLLYAVALAGWLTPVCIVVFLTMDGFPQPFLIIVEVDYPDSAIARWEPLLWVQVGVATLSVAGALFNTSHDGKPPAQAAMGTFPSPTGELLHLDLARIRRELSQAKDAGRNYPILSPRVKIGARS